MASRTQTVNALLRPLLGIALLCAMAAAVPAQPGTILVTGFEPFGGDTTNGSWEAVQHLQGKRFGDETVVVAQLPVVWGKAGDELRELIRKYHPQAVIAFGQAGAEPVRIETIARNERKPYKDNAGALPPTDTVAASAPATIPTGLDVAAVRKSLQTAKIPVVESKDAGGYLCNETFYVLMDDPDAQAIPRGFVHVPPLDATVTGADGGKTHFDRKTLAAAADAVVGSVAASLPTH